MIRLALVLLLLLPSLGYAEDSVKESDQLDFAQGLLSRGMYDMAVAQFQKFIADYPQSPSLAQAYLSLGESYFLSQDFDHATLTYNQFQKLYPHADQFSVSVVRLGQIDIRQKKYDEAIKELSSIDAASQKPEIQQSLDYYIAQAYDGQSDAAHALDFYQKASLVQGASSYTAYAFEQIGNILTKSAKYPDALDAYTKAQQSTQDKALKDELTYKTAQTQFLSGQYNEAIKDFQLLVGQSSPFAQDALANMLLAYFNLSQYDQLIQEYKKNAAQIKDEESYFPVHLAAVLAYIELKQYTDANALLDRMLAIPNLKPLENARIFIKKAEIFIQQKKYKDGLALLNAYASDNIDGVDEALFFKGEGYYGLADYDKAFSFFENVSLNFPQSRYAKAALLGEAHCRQLSGRFKESEDLFLKYYAVQDDPVLKSQALFDAIVAAAKAGDEDAVIQHGQEYLKVFAASDQYSDVLLILGNSYDKHHQPQAAVDLLQGYLSKSPALQKPNSVYFLLGFNEQLLGAADQALAAYAKIDEHKEDGRFYLGSLKNTAIIYLSQGKQDAAKVCFDRLISHAGATDLGIKTYIWVCNEYLKEQRFADVLRIAAEAEKHFSGADLQRIKYYEAEALRAMGRCDEADKDYEQVIASSQKDVYSSSAHIGEGLCLSKASKWDEAKQDFQKALDESPDDYTITAHARFEMANTEAAAGHMDEALKLYLLVATIYDNDQFCSQSLLQAAKISEKLKRKDDALKMYAEIISKYPSTKAADEAQKRISALK